jgi:hypothetical protein
MSAALAFDRIASRHAGNVEQPAPGDLRPFGLSVVLEIPPPPARGLLEIVFVEGDGGKIVGRVRIVGIEFERPVQVTPRGSGTAAGRCCETAA